MTFASPVRPGGGRTVECTLGKDDPPLRAANLKRALYETIPKRSLRWASRSLSDSIRTNR
jgi:hypothetical protein